MKHKILAIGDIHLNHLHTKTTNTIKSLKQLLSTEQYSVLVINGDFFDRLVQSESSNYHHILSFIIWIVKHCEMNNITLLVNKGTQSHDYEQLLLFQTIIDSYEINIEFKYFDSVSYYTDKHNNTYLFIPDDMGSNNSVLDKARKLLIEQTVGSVDYVVIHCMFDYQAPVASVPSYDSEAWGKLADKLVINSHIHNHSKHGKIVAVGSWDRLTFGDDIVKGCISITDNHFRFIENTNAQTYKTYIDDESVSITVLDEMLRKCYLNNWFIKVKSNRTSVMVDRMKRFNIAYFKIESMDKKEKVKTNTFDDICTVNLDTNSIIEHLSKTGVGVKKIKTYIKHED